MLYYKQILTAILVRNERQVVMANIDFQKYRTEVLEEILRTEQYDGRSVTVEEILEICGVLVSRRDEPSRVEEAWAEFVEHYMPQSFKL